MDMRGSILNLFIPVCDKWVGELSWTIGRQQEPLWHENSDRNCILDDGEGLDRCQNVESFAGQNFLTNVLDKNENGTLEYRFKALKS